METDLTSRLETNPVMLAVTLTRKVAAVLRISRADETHQKLLIYSIFHVQL